MLTPLLDIEGATENYELAKARAVNAAYVSPVRRVLATVDRFSADTRQPARLELVLAALAMRAPNLAMNTRNLELCALRKFCECMLQRQSLAKLRGEHIVPWQVVPENLAAPEWAIETTWQEFADLHAALKETNASELFRKGLVIGCGAMQRHALRSGLGPDPGVILEICGIKNAWPVVNARRKPKRNWEKIGRQDLEALLDELRSSKENFGIETLKGRCADISGISKLLASACWLTGMRGSEVFSCRILVAASSTTVGAAEKSEMLRDPIGAHRAGKLKELDESCMADYSELRRKIVEASALASVPPMILIKTVKTACSARNIDNRLRVQILEGISPDDLEVLCLASQLRHAELTPFRIEILVKSCSKKIKRASLQAFPGRRDPVTLHYFRHAFADAARRILPIQQVAALTGHTSRKTAHGYGGKFVRRSSSAKSTRWLPKHDPTLAEAIERAWSSQLVLGREFDEPKPAMPEF